MNLNQLKNILRECRIRPSRNLGQNFLVDGNVLDILIQSSDLSPEDNVLEIGPGLGILTEALAARAGRVLAAEVDARLAALTRNRLSECGNLEILTGDVLKNKNRLQPEVVTKLRSLEPFKLIANLPYAVAVPAILNLMKLPETDISMMVFTIQKEVGDRMLRDGQSGKSEYAGVAANTWGRVEWIKTLSPQVFYPRPRVDSCIIRITPQPDRLDRAVFGKFCSFVKKGFAMPRKTIANNLAGFLDRPAALNALSEARIPPENRPEDLSRTDWIRLFRQSSWRQ